MFYFLGLVQLLPPSASYCTNGVSSSKLLLFVSGQITVRGLFFCIIRWCNDPDHSRNHGLATASPEGHEGPHYHVWESRPGGEQRAGPHPVDGGRPQRQQGVRQARNELIDTHLSHRRLSWWLSNCCISSFGIKAHYARSAKPSGGMMWFDEI